MNPRASHEPKVGFRAEIEAPGSSWSEETPFPCRRSGREFTDLLFTKIQQRRNKELFTVPSNIKEVTRSGWSRRPPVLSGLL